MAKLRFVVVLSLCIGPTETYQVNFSLQAVIGDRLQTLQKKLASQPTDANLQDEISREQSTRDQWQVRGVTMS